MHVKDANDPSEAWKALEAYFQRSNLGNRLFLRKKFLSMKLNEGTDMESHINELIMLGEQLKSSGEKLSDEDIVATLLCSLPSSYDPLVTALESRDEADLKLDFVKGRLLHEERKMNKESDASDMAMLSKKRFQKGPRFNGQFRGAPNGANGFNRSSHHQGSSKTIVCFNCNKPGHIKRNCRERKQEAYAAKNEDEEERCFVVNSTSDDGWYIDSGASSQMSSNRDLFKYYEEVNNSEIVLADKRVVYAIGKGTIYINCKTPSGEVVRPIKDVLHVPDLGINLFSVSKVTGKGFQVSFYDDKCIIKCDGTIVAQAYREGGLFKLDTGINTAYASKVSSKAALWHQSDGPFEHRWTQKDC